MTRSTTPPRADALAGGPRTDSHPGRSSDPRLTQLSRFQWAVRAALALGVAASVCANVLHAQHNPIAQTIAAWPPLALMLTVELISRVPVYRRTLAVLRLLATACIAAYVSYFHMAAIVSRFGEHQPNPYLLPISADGLIVVASVSLVELAGRVRTIRDERPEPDPMGSPSASYPPRQDHATASAPLVERSRTNGHVGIPSEATRPLLTTAPPTSEPPVSATTTPPLAESTQPTPPLPTPATEPSTTGPAVRLPVEPSATTTTPPFPAPSPPTEPSPAESPPVEPPTDDGTQEPQRGGDDQDDAIDPDLAALLPAARAARDTLRHHHRGLTRDSLAAQLRRDGHTIRTSRVSALLNLLRNDEPATVNGRSPTAPS